MKFYNNSYIILYKNTIFFWRIHHIHIVIKQQKLYFIVILDIYYQYPIKLGFVNSKFCKPKSEVEKAFVLNIELPSGIFG